MWVLLWFAIWGMFGFQNFLADVNTQDPNTWNIYYTMFWVALISQIIRSGKKKIKGK